MRKKLLIILAFIAIPMIMIIASCGKENDDKKNVVTSNPQQEGNTGTTVVQDNTGTNITPPATIEDPIIVEINKEIPPANCQYPDTASIIISKKGASSLSVSVKLSSIGLFSYGSYLAYDPSVYQFISYEPTSAMGNSGETLVTATEMHSTEGAAGIVFSGDNAQPGKRVVLVSHSRLGYGTSGVSINEVVGKINFKIKTNSASEFIFSGTSISTKNGALSPAILKNHCWPQQLVIQ